MRAWTRGSFKISWTRSGVGGGGGSVAIGRGYKPRLGRSKSLTKEENMPNMSSEDMRFPFDSPDSPRLSSNVLFTASGDLRAATTTSATSSREILPMILSPCRASSMQGSSSSSFNPVGRMIVYASPEPLTAISPLYFQLRIPPGLSCTMGISFFLSSSVTTALRSTPALETITNCGLGAMYVWIPPDNSKENLPASFPLSMPLNSNLLMTRPML
mmetsp:Transcript_3531/g.22201  ORF Transcript_3531/g.22201 Transcript_3531/m.22201 type:complete len:215 (+) Transcript_3531:99-743(+)